MAKSKKSGKAKKGFLSKLMFPITLSGIAALVGLIVIINPFNIVKILKNNYPDLLK